MIKKVIELNFIKRLLIKNTNCFSNKIITKYLKATQK